MSGTNTVQCSPIHNIVLLHPVALCIPISAFSLHSLCANLVHIRVLKFTLRKLFVASYDLFKAASFGLTGHHQVYKTAHENCCSPLMLLYFAFCTYPFLVNVRNTRTQQWEKVLEEVFSMWSAPCPVLGNGRIYTHSDNRRGIFYVVRAILSAGNGRMNARSDTWNMFSIGSDPRLYNESLFVEPVTISHGTLDTWQYFKLFYRILCRGYFCCAHMFCMFFAVLCVCLCVAS
jgi:hypothetical protein